MTADIRYYAAACQTNLPNPRDRDGIREQIDHGEHMIDLLPDAVTVSRIGQIRLASGGIVADVGRHEDSCPYVTSTRLPTPTSSCWAALPFVTAISTRPLLDT